MSLSLSPIPTCSTMLKCTLELGTLCGSFNEQCPSQAQVSEYLVLGWQSYLGRLRYL